MFSKIIAFNKSLIRLPSTPHDPVPNDVLRLPLAFRRYFTSQLEERDEKIRQLEREADWLAETILTCVYETYGKLPCPMNKVCNWIGYGPSPSISDCVKCWRETARKEVKNDYA